MATMVCLCCSKTVVSGTPFVLRLHLNAPLKHTALFLLGCSHPLLVKSRRGVWPLRVSVLQTLDQQPLLLHSTVVQKPVDIELYVSADVNADLSDPAQRQGAVRVQLVPRHRAVFSGSMA